MLNKKNYLKQSQPELYIFQSELRAIAKEASKYKYEETGGDLYGLWTHGNRPIIFFATGPGRNASRTSYEFQQDHEYIMECESFLYKKFGLQYLGDWHSHHNLNLASPSHGDVDRICRYSEKTKRSRLVEIIVTHKEGGAGIFGAAQLEQINSYLYLDITRSTVQPITANLCELEETESPIRQVSTYRVQFPPNINGLDNWQDFSLNKIFIPKNEQVKVANSSISEEERSKITKKLGKYSNDEWQPVVDREQEEITIVIFIKKFNKRMALVLDSNSLEIKKARLFNNETEGLDELEIAGLPNPTLSHKHLEAAIEKIISQ